MKKKVVGLISILLIAMVGLTGCGDGLQLSFIVPETAQAAALDAAHLKPEQVENIQVELDKKNGRDYYEVIFRSGGETYEYDVDAVSGKVIEGRTPAGSFSTATVGDADIADSITVEQAKAIAFKDAGVNADQVKYVKTEMERDDGLIYYEVEFYNDKSEYDYEIDAKSGVIMEKDFDAEDFDRPVANPNQGGNNNGIIAAEKAKEIALKDAGLAASQVKFVEVELDEDDGRWQYDVEFYTSKSEYDYEIDAKTGKILEKDFDAENYDRPESNNQSSNNNGTISADKAKQIALKQVPGATASNIREFEVDYDDGRLEYEGKIIYKGMEYEFEIDGYSGAIRDWDAESLDDDDDDD